MLDRSVASKSGQCLFNYLCCSARPGTSLTHPPSQRANIEGEISLHGSMFTLLVTTIRDYWELLASLTDGEEAHISKEESLGIPQVYLR